ncbi:MAG: DUF1800 domain-containing protein [Planctomycetota bacterium]
MDGPSHGIQPTRRAILLGGAALAAATSTGTASASGSAALAAQSQAAGLSGLAPWFLGRASYGATPSMLQDLRARGFQGWIDWQLEPDLIDDSDLDARLAPFDWIGQTVAEMWGHPTKSGRVIGYEARAVRLLRATHSRRQLFERVVEFWTDHFNVYGSADDLWLLKIVDDAEVVRTHALGKFRDLLQASAKSPAMVEYLDNDTNVAGAPQENYAREVMELHTLGVNGPYGEADVRELARCLTGWSYWKLNESQTRYGEFRYHPARHDSGPKQVLGIDIPGGGGLTDAERVLDHLADHPSTVDFVTTKLAKWFLGYEPPARAIDAAKATWVATGGDIKEIVRTLLSPRFMHAAAPWENPKLKRPLHWVASLHRTTGATLLDPVGAVVSMASLGHTAFDWHDPNGYPDTEEAWSSLLIWRWKYAARFSQGLETSLAHTIQDLRALLGSVPMASWAAHLSQLLTGGTMDRRDVQGIQDYINSIWIPTDEAVAEAFELTASSPSFGRY